MRVGYVNEIDTATLTASSEEPGFLVENIQDSRMTRKWHGFTSGVTSIEVSGSIKADMAVVNAHNAVSGDTIELKGYTTAGRTVLDTTITFDINAYGTAEVFAEKTLYWTFEFDTASAIEIGGLFLGEGLILPSYEIGHSWSQVAGDDVFVSKTKQLYGLNPFQYRRASFLIPTVTWDEQVDVGTWFETVGKSQAFYLLQYTDRQDLRPVFYCRLVDDDFRWQEHEKNIQVYKDVPVNIEEVF